MTGVYLEMVLDFGLIYWVNRTEVAECFGVDLSERDAVLFGKSFAVLVFGDSFDKRAVEVSALGLDRAPLRLDFDEVAAEFDPIGGRESHAKGCGFGEEEFYESVAMYRRTEDSDLCRRSALLHVNRCEEYVKCAVFKELGRNVAGNFWGHIVYISFNDVYIVGFGVLMRCL